MCNKNFKEIVEGESHQEYGILKTLYGSMGDGFYYGRKLPA